MTEIAMRTANAIRTESPVEMDDDDVEAGPCDLLPQVMLLVRSHACTVTSPVEHEPQVPQARSVVVVGATVWKVEPRAQWVKRVHDPARKSRLPLVLQPWSSSTPALSAATWRISLEPDFRRDRRRGCRPGSA